MRKPLKSMAAGALGAAVIALAAMMPASAEVPESSDPIKLAINEWTGQVITTHVAGEILSRMGYTVEYTTAGYLPQFEAIQDGTVTASLEIWSNNVGDAFATAEATGNIVNVGDLGVQAGEAWYYPKYMEEQCPGLPSVDAFVACAELFSTPETFPNGRLLDYPLDWGSRNAAVIEAMQLPYTVVPGGSEGALVAEFKAAYERQEPIVMMFWSPHWLHAEVETGVVELPVYDPACDSDPAWGRNPDATGDCFYEQPTLFKVAWVGMADKWPAAFRFLEAYTFSAEDQIPLIAKVDAQGMDMDTVIKEWVDQNEAKWRPMVDAALAGN